MKRKKKKPAAWLMISYFEKILKRDLDYETKAIIGKNCPKYLMAVKYKDWRNVERKVYVKEETLKDFRVMVKIERDMIGSFYQISFPGEIPEGQLTKALVLKRLISKNL